MLAMTAAATAALAQKPGGVLRMPLITSPASMSIHEESTIATLGPMMGVFNNLVMYDQHVPQNSLNTIIPDLAESWSLGEDGKTLTFKLRHGVKWHDGQPFTAKDVVCTWDLMADNVPDKLRLNPRKSSYDNVDSVIANGDDRVTFHLKQPQPAFPMLLAGGFSAIYPCHVTATQMRQHPIGTGPFKFVAFKPNESINVARNSDYWKPNRPYLDGIEYTIISDPSTAVLAFRSGQEDMTQPYDLTVPVFNDVCSQMPRAVCELSPGMIPRHLLINRDKPPFDYPELRRAMALSIDRKAFVDILAQGQGEIGGVLQPAPGGLWGMPADQIGTLAGYDPDVQKNRDQARQIMQQLGYGPDKPLKIKVTTRDWFVYRDPAVLLIDQLKHVYVESELEQIDTPQYFPKILRKDYTVALNLQTAGPDPDPILKLFYGCGSSINWDGYCSPEVDKLIEAQSREGDADRRKQILWAIEHKLADDNARPIIFYNRTGTCRQPYVKGLTVMVNSIFNGWRMEDVWLDKP
jgi:peptide/nickel transport system substrate-binding protein